MLLLSDDVSPLASSHELSKQITLSCLGIQLTRVELNIIGFKLDSIG